METSITQKTIEEWIRLGEVQAVWVIGNSSPIAVKGSVYLRSLNSKERTRRALKALLGGWGIALVTVLIPLLHFILVPSFFFGAIVVAYVLYQQQAIRLGGITSCPKCKAEFVIIKGVATWPLKDVCARCQENVFIEPAPKGDPR